MGGIARAEMTWTFEVDWDKDGTYTNETAYIQKLIIRRGRRESISGDSYAHVDIGELSATAIDPGGRYNFFNTSSALNGYLIPNRPVRVKYTDGDLGYWLYQGLLSDIRNQRKEKVSRLEAKDHLRYLTDRDGDNVALHTDQTVRDAIADLLLAAEFTNLVDALTFPFVFPGTLDPSDLDDNGDLIPIWWGDPTKKVLDQINEIADAFAGSFFINTDGVAAYRARAQGGAAVVTLNDADVKDDTDMQQPWDEVRNQIRIVAKPRTTTPTTTDEIWRLYDKPYIAAGASLTIWAEYQYDGEYAPYKTVVTPVNNTDYESNTLEDGTGTDGSGSIAIVMTTYTTEAKLVITNNAAYGQYITMLKLRGQLYIAPQSSTMTASDTDSQTAYDKRGLTIESRWMQDTVVAQMHADHAKLLYANPRKVVWVVIHNRPSIQFACDLFDKVALNLTELSATGSYQVTYIEHAIDRKDMRTTWRLEEMVSNLWIFPAAFDDNTLGW